MRKITFALAMALTAVAFQSASAQDLLAEKNVYTLGEAKTWTSSNDVEYSFITEDLAKLTAVPTNTSNIYLFPEAGGGWDTAANKEIGIQGFYVDLGTSTLIGSVSSTWEGAAANAYDIYLTDVIPTTAILSTTPTYSATGLGQYQQNTAVLPDGSRGRYLVFQVTDPTNWGWGVKIRSISATAPQKSELTQFTVTPGIAILGQPVDLKVSTLDQLGIAIENVTISVSDNATYSDGKLTINSGDFATLTATYNNVSLEAKVYAAVAPSLPSAANIATPIFSNTVSEYNDSAVFTTVYNGGAQDYGLFTFENGEVAQGFGNVLCIFFSNEVTTGAWNANIDPDTNGWLALCLDIFSTRDVAGYIEFEGTSDPDLVPASNPFSLEAGKWNPVIVNIKGVNKLNNMSVRFSEENKCDLMLANIYFTASQISSTVETIAPATESLEVYTLQGVRVLSDAKSTDLNQLPAGLYIANGRKIVVR